MSPGHPRDVPWDFGKGPATISAQGMWLFSAVKRGEFGFALIR